MNNIAMGYIKGVFGVKGWLKVKADTEYVDGLLDYPHWQLRKDDVIRQMKLEQGKVVNGALHVKFYGIDNRESAELLRGYTVEISRDLFEATQEDEYYWADLIGMRVSNREGLNLGVVKDLMQTGAHDVLIVSGDFGQKLIPFVSQYIDQVMEHDRCVVVDWGIDY